MTAHPYQVEARALAPALYEAISPSFPGASVLIQAPDEAEALARAVRWLAGCVVGGLRDG